MADNTNPALPYWLQQLQAGNVDTGANIGGKKFQNGAYFDPATGQFYTPTYSTSSGGAEGGDQARTLAGYSSSANTPDVKGKQNQTYDLSGNPTGSFATYGNSNFDGQDLAGVLSVLGVMAGGVGLQGALGGAGATGGAVAGPGEAGWGMDLGAEGLAGATPTSGIGATLTGTAGGPLTAGGAGSALAGTGALSSVAAPIAPSIAAPTAGAGLLSGLSGNALGLGATALGGLLGSQGVKTENSTQNKMDPRMDPYVYGDQGVLQYAQGLLNKQMAPGYMQGYEDMRTQGQGLLNQPIAGNGFSKFFPGR